MGKEMTALASYFLPHAQKLFDDAVAAGLDPVVEDTDRTVTEQLVKVSTGVSWTQRSKHLPQPPEGKSEAIDIVPRVCMALKYWGWNGTIENSHPHWGSLIAIARKNPNLKCGVDFILIHNGVPKPRPDPGHFEYRTYAVTGVEAETT